MSHTLALKSLLSETKKLISYDQQKFAFLKEELYRIICSSYSKLDQPQRYQYIQELARMHDYNKDKFHSVMSRDTTSEALRVRKMYSIKECFQPKYRNFFINLGRIPFGIKLLIDLRTDILDIQKLIATHIGPVTSDIQKQNISPSDMPHKHKVTHSFCESSHSSEKSNVPSSLHDLLHSLTSPENSSNLYVLNAELKDLLNVWFAGGLCILERVTWNSSCHILQRISELEAVHPVKGWLDIKLRVGSYRRCHIYTHPCMPNEPVVILHSALCTEIPSNIQEIVSRKFQKVSQTIDEIEDHEKIKAAVFYSISSPHKGLTGIDLGNSLIKKVVQQLKYEFPKLDQFSTLSPLPNFREWLCGKIEYCLAKEVNSRIINDSVTSMSYIYELFTTEEIHFLNRVFHTSTVKDLLTQFQLRLEGISHFTGSKNLTEFDEQTTFDYKLLSWLLKNLAARYLFNEKHRGYALDPVCNFHLKNGAVLWRINWLADSSPRGLNLSFGIMANYRYFLEYTETYSRQYIENKKINVSEDVNDILKGVQPPELVN